jgi:hypothetical protein
MRNCTSYRLSLLPQLWHALQRTIGANTVRCFIVFHTTNRVCQPIPTTAADTIGRLITRHTTNAVCQSDYGPVWRLILFSLQPNHGSVQQLAIWDTGI